MFRPLHGVGTGTKEMLASYAYPNEEVPGPDAAYPGQQEVVQHAKQTLRPLLPLNNILSHNGLHPPQPAYSYHSTVLGPHLMLLDSCAECFSAECALSPNLLRVVTRGRPVVKSLPPHNNDEYL